mgnify:CR=1 FL=1
MSNNHYQECSRCVMDTSDPQISFNERGECNLCTEYLEKRAQHQYQGKSSDDQLNELVSQIKKDGEGKEYDCIIGLSGGIDSSYATYILKEKGLRVLAVHLDNGWNSEEAALNIKNIAKKLDVDYESYVLNWNEFKDLQLSFLKASVPEAETPTDIAIHASWYHFTNKYNIKYIISGGNFATEGILPKYWHYNAKDLKYLKSIQSKFGTKKIKSIPTFGFISEMYQKLWKKAKVIYILNYVPYSKDEAMSFLKEKFDWKYYGGKHYESKYTGFIQSYYLYKKFGIDYRRATLSSQICLGQTTRETALKELEQLPYNMENVHKEIQYIAKKLGITITEFEEIINLPPKWYIDYPNNEKFLSLIYNSYRKLFKKDKLGNF